MAGCKIFLSDEGYGHIVRQRAVVEELKILDPTIDIAIQTQRHIEAAKRFIPDVKTINRFNNITWHKSPNGSPDLAAIGSQFENYVAVSEKFISDELENAAYDFVISDFCFEAFEIAQRKKIPSFGVAHFTWDWFFSKLYPPPLQSDVLQYMMKLAHQASVLFFPPFTPSEILKHYEKNKIEVPLVLRKNIEHKVTENESRFKVLIADSGAGVISDSIHKALQSVAELDDMLFFVAEKFKCSNKNVTYIPENDLMVDYIHDMDLVIGRAGYNTICECVGLRTPMLLLGEAMNPEINENILMLKQEHLASFISLKTFEKDLGSFLPRFIQHEYNFIKQSMVEHNMPVNGAEVIATEILNRI